MLIMAALLGLFALVGTGIVAFTQDNTRERIAENERQTLLRSLHALVPPALHDNDLIQDVIVITDQPLLGSRKPVKVFRARMQGQPVAAIVACVAPDGYSGDINLLVAINYEGKILGVRAVTHHETPGLGDYIEIQKSKWIYSFEGHSLADPGDLGWHVIKDGGIFDQFTGATITPRAVVKAVHNSLKYFAAHREQLFSAPSPDPSGDITHGQQR
ncbi:MAG: electron transport complex subunit RsxG [Gammaproteobacteria bacterium]|nr:electron transport complex subunit RsxG [Gammaproteobacteria bacterium]